MSALNVKFGKGFIKLRKSPTIVGLKTKETESTSRNLDAVEEEKTPEFVDKQFFKDLGGFSVVSLKTEEATVDRKLDEVREKEEVELGTHVYYAEGSNKPLIPTGEIFITFEEGVSLGEQGIALDEYSLELIERIDEDEIRVKVSAHSPNPIKTSALLQEVSLVKYAEPDLDMPLDHYAFRMPSDQLVPQQWHLQNSGFLPDTQRPLFRGADAKVVAAWRRLGSLGNSSVTIAVMDNGFDLSHPDLRDKVTKPFDLWSQSSNIHQGDPQHTHGTPCASVALANSNGNGMVGAAPQAKFMPISGVSFSTGRTEQMFDYCIRNGADIISCSWGTTEYQFQLNAAKERAIARAAREGRNGKGCIILFAAGNEDYDYLNFYATHPDVIAVGASTSMDKHASYSNRGRELSVVAPSNGDWPILAARAWWDPGWSWKNGQFKYWMDGRSRGDRYKHFGGTSSATPLVAGICALILSANPDLTAREVKEILQQTADKIGSPSSYYYGHSRTYGYGRVNAEKAVAEALRRKNASIVTPNIPSIPTVPETPTTGGSTGTELFRVDVEKQPAKGWGIQIGAYTDYNNVIVQTNRMKQLFGEPVVVASNQVNGQMIYKIVVGNYISLQEAKSLQNRMKGKGINGFPRKLSDL